MLFLADIYCSPLESLVVADGASSGTISQISEISLSRTLQMRARTSVVTFPPVAELGDSGRAEPCKIFKLCLVKVLVD